MLALKTATPASGLRCDQRKPQTSPRRAPVVIVNSTRTPQSGSFHASSRINAASAAVGGDGLGRGVGGGSVWSIGLTAIHPQRTARVNDPLRMAWTTRMLAGASGVHRWGPQALSHHLQGASGSPVSSLAH